jgi:hypothetical protein
MKDWHLWIGTINCERILYCHIVGPTYREDRDSPPVKSIPDCNVILHKEGRVLTQKAPNEIRRQCEPCARREWNALLIPPNPRRTAFGPWKSSTHLKIFAKVDKGREVGTIHECVVGKLWFEKAEGSQCFLIDGV